ncbi:rod-binding protein [Pelagibacterium xiamenense]|uniref:rod-binding protein n=1 Tax=Pelagibacterium xiamenense TaxID=2901140 RepID=UPI001E3A5EA9|nr:rod-binding protein [Pelagibacterium xiamenense]MCD7060024.1 rod-binding protein [Pelagibacterium xiamenense]
MDAIASRPLALDATDQPRIDRLREKAEELEGVFLNTLVSEMFKGLSTDESGFGGGHAEETWRGMLSEQYAAEMAKAGGIGVADQILASLAQDQQALNVPINHAIGAYQR